MQIDDEILMAYADGELPEAEAAELRAALAVDPELAARLVPFARSRALLQALPLPEETPATAASDAKLAAMIRAASVAPVKVAATPPVTLPQAVANLNARPYGVIAAALAIAAIGIGWWQLHVPIPGGVASAEVAALERLPSGEGELLENGRQLVMISSYQSAEDGFCREYETHLGKEMRISVACREGKSWAERFAVDLISEGEIFLPASGSIQDLDDFLTTSRMGAPLSPEEEALALLN